MDFDPNPPTEERNRSGPRWYSVIAFLVIAFLLLLNAVAMFVNAEANSEQACYAKYAAGSQLVGARAGTDKNATRDLLVLMLEECAGLEDSDK
jgi:hypothetical protein